MGQPYRDQVVTIGPPRAARSRPVIEKLPRRKASLEHCARAAGCVPSAVAALGGPTPLLYSFGKCLKFCAATADARRLWAGMGPAGAGCHTRLAGWGCPMPAPVYRPELNTIENTKHRLHICTVPYGNQAGRPHTTSIYGPCNWVLER